MSFEETDNPWVELAKNGLTRADQIEDYKDWLAVRQSALDQLRMRWDESYSYHCPTTNLFRLDQIESAQFRLDVDRWELERFVNPDSREEPGI